MLAAQSFDERLLWDTQHPMAEPPAASPTSAAADELPAAVPDPQSHRRVPYVWILPALVVLAGVFVAIQQKIAQGTSIEIGFRTADDLEPNKTKIRYKAVEIGEVTAIHVAKDRKQVIVTAKIHRDASDYLVADTRFWVVRPRVTGGSVTGLGTLVSGAYIDVDVGHSSVERRTFTGLEVPPVVTSGLPGRQFILHAEDIGSLTIGSTVFYRHIPAGRGRGVRSRSGRRQRHHQGVHQFALRCLRDRGRRGFGRQAASTCRSAPTASSCTPNRSLHSRGRRRVSAGGRIDLDGAGRGGHLLSIVSGPRTRHAGAERVGADVRHVLQGLPARPVGRRTGRPSRHHHR